MNHSTWQYTPSREIKNFKDLEIEKQRLALHQQFLGDLLEKDKLLLKQTLHPSNLLIEAMNSLLDDNEKAKGKSRSSGFFQFIKWLINLIV